jgi:hypothetical protein
MKIEFTDHRELIDIGRTVKHGDVLESPLDAPEDLLQAYVSNGIARNLPPPTPPKTGGELESPPPSSKEGLGVVALQINEGGN